MLYLAGPYSFRKRKNMGEMNCNSKVKSDYISELTVLHVPINNDNYCYIFSILAHISDCEEIIRKKGSTSEGYYVKFRYNNPDEIIITIDNGHNHLKTFAIRLGDLIIAKHIFDVIFDCIVHHKESIEAEYNVFVRMEGNINKDDFKCRLYFYNSNKKFRINFCTSPKEKIYPSIRNDALVNLDRMGESHLWLNEHLVGSYI